MKRIKSFFRINPIIVKELRSRMRGPRAFLTLTISLVANLFTAVFISHLLFDLTVRKSAKTLSI